MARDYDVLPGCIPALRARHHVVYCRLTVRELDATILALIAVAAEEIYSGEWGTSLSELNEAEKADYRRHLYRQRDRANFTLIAFNHLNFSEEK